MSEVISLVIMALSTGMFVGSALFYRAAQERSRDTREQLKELYGYRVSEVIWKRADFEDLYYAVEKKAKEMDDRADN